MLRPHSGVKPTVEPRLGDSTHDDMSERCQEENYIRIEPHTHRTLSKTCGYVPGAYLGFCHGLNIGANELSDIQPPSRTIIITIRIRKDGA